MNEYTTEPLRQSNVFYDIYGSCALPVTETDTKTENMCSEPMEICIGFGLGPL